MPFKNREDKKCWDRYYQKIYNKRRVVKNPSGNCEICETHVNKLDYDHDHKLKRFRGWLCGSCNRGLGLFKDNPEVLNKAIVYLTKVERTKEPEELTWLQWKRLDTGNDRFVK